MQRNNPVWGKWVVATLAAGALAVVFVNMVIDNMPKGDPQKVAGYIPWEKETLKVVESLPLQDGGRIKPFATYAGFKMLQLHGARSMKVEGQISEKDKNPSGFKQFIWKLRGKKPGEYRIKPTEWLMDTLFRPELAVNLPTFRVDNSQVLESIGVETKGRRDRYSYAEIAPCLEKLVKLAESYESIEKKERDPEQQQSIDLAYNIRNYESLLGYFSFARRGIELREVGVETQANERANLSAVMTAAPKLDSEVQAAEREKRKVEPLLEDLLQQVMNAANYSKYGMFILPPKNASDTQWQSAGNSIMSVMTLESKDPRSVISDIQLMETAVRSVSVSEKEFRKHFTTFKESTEKRADSRGELQRIAMEVSYFKRDYFLNSMVCFLLGTVCALAMWGIGSGKTGKILSWATLGFTVIGALYCVTAIVIRCLIMNRPPVGNLYDTIIFIGATGVIFALLIEWMNRQRFALGLAPIIGLALIMLARRYEVGDAGDHLDPLVAVLDSNFWLATHVITITLGYSAGLLAAMLSCGYVLMRGLNLDSGNKDLRRSLTKAVYGSICLTVFLSLVGTVLGGIWANYSWGRFWGWDPKENGALMIVLWTLAILHARMGGIIKEWGLHLASLFTACIVAFSWWHVNFLGVGLHNYGFTADKKFMIFIFYGIMMIFILFGAVAMLVERYEKQAKTATKTKAVKGLEA